MTPLWIRLWHWAIALLFVILVVTGVVLTYSTAHFALMDYALADWLHQVLGIAFSVLFGLFVVVAGANGYWRRYLRQSQGLGARIRLHGSNVVAGGAASPEPGSEIKSRVELSRGLLFLVQQLLSILSVAVLSPLLVATGLALLFPELAPAEILGADGLWAFALAHYWVGLAGALFLLFHAYIATVGGLKRMIRGR